MPRPRTDLTGRQFGSWTVIQFDRSNRHRVWWRVRCGCGAEASVRADSLTGGGSTRCARCQKSAISRTHGATGTPTWKTWHAMRMRCLSPSAADYPRYGGRGIRVCAAWGSYERFLADMGERPSGMTLDRIDPDGDYSPDNCRWATVKEQNRNRRRTVFLEANGQRKSLSEWAEQLGFSHIALYKRYAAGWSDEEIVNTPRLPPTSPKPRGARPRRRPSTSPEGLA